MDNKDLLKKFEERYEVLNERREKIHADIVMDKTENEEQYLAYEEAAKRNMEAASVLNPKLHMIYEEEKSLNEQLDILDKEIVKIASDVVKNIKENTAEVEKKISVQEKHIEDLENEITKMQEEVVALKDSQEYKSGDEETHLKVEDMEDMIKTKAKRKEKLSKSVESLKAEVLELNKQIDDYLDRYNIEDVDISKSNVETENKKDVEVEENNENNENKENKEKEENEEKSPKSKVAKKTSYMQGGIPAFEGEHENESSQEEKNKEENEEKDYKALKKDFNELYKKAKSKAPLTAEDYKKLAEIMKDKENYDKLGITTGVIFNKSKVIFKAMAKSATITGPTLRNARDLLGMKIEPASEKNGMVSTDSIRSWSGLKNLSKDTHVKIASEKLFEEVIKLDRESLTDEQKNVWDNAKRHVEEFGLLKNSLDAYNEVVEDRKQPRSYNAVKKLDAAKEEKEEVVSNVEVKENKSLDLSDKVNDVIEDVPKKSTEDITLNKEEI